MKKIQSEYDDLDKYIDESKNTYYYKKDTKIKHNPYGPAFINKTGYKEYWIEDKYHRLDGAAVIYSDGDVEYFINDIFIGHSKQEFYSSIKYLKSKTINKQDKINILDIKNCVLNGLSFDTINILKLIL